MRVLLVLAVVTVGLVASGCPAVGAAAASVHYVPPVPGPVVDPWDAPDRPFGPGNRGVDLAAERGDPVRSAADGVVSFAGTVAGQHHVVVLHPDGRGTTD